MTKRQKRLLAILIILGVLLVSLLVYFGYYRSTKQLRFDLGGAGSADIITPPQFLYTFSGEGSNRTLSPVGVLVDDGQVYVTDSRTGRVQVFSEDGDWLRSIGASESVTPLYIAKNPKNGNLYVSDRRTRSVHMYTVEGKYLGDFRPNLPKDQLPKFETGGVEWVPLALAFGKDGTLYATEILNGHRLLIFDPTGKFQRSVGTAAIVLEPTEAPGVFQFPNGITIVGNELYIADSNNRRVQVFDLTGEFKRIIVTQGLPRGVAPLGPLPSDEASSPARFVTVDTLAHDATMWEAKGTKVLNFGEQGLLDGQFSYPTGVAVGTKNRIFIADTSNARVQVWGWPEQVASAPIVGAPRNFLWCLLPLLLLPLLLLLRRRRFYATADFVGELVEMGEADLLSTIRRVRWVTTEQQMPAIREVAGSQQTVDLFDVWQYSSSDVEALVAKYEIDETVAIDLAVAQRTRLLCTEDERLRALAPRVEVESMNADEFVRKYSRRPKDAESDGSGATA